MKHWRLKSAIAAFALGAMVPVYAAGSSSAVPAANSNAASSSGNGASSSSTAARGSQKGKPADTSDAPGHELADACKGKTGDQLRDCERTHPQEQSYMAKRSGMTKEEVDKATPSPQDAAPSNGREETHSGKTK